MSFRKFLELALLLLVGGSVSPQNQEGVLDWVPTPAGPLELVSVPAHALLTPAERTAALELMDRARQNINLFIPRGTAFDPPDRLGFNKNARGQEWADSLNSPVRAFNPRRHE